jgi:Zn-dependent protease
VARVGTPGRGRSGLHSVGGRPGGLRPRAGWAAYLDPYGTVAAVGIALFSAAGGEPSNLGFINVSDALHGNFHGLPTDQAIALGFAMMNLACALLALLPIPPLEMGVVLWSRLPRTPGPRRVAFHLLEESWGVAVVLVLLLLPLGGQLPLLLVLIDALADPLLGLL